MRLVVDEVAFGQVFLLALRFFRAIIRPVLHATFTTITPRNQHVHDVAKYPPKRLFTDHILSANFC